MPIKFAQEIQESEEDLAKLEHCSHGQKRADRVRLLRLLKSEPVNSLKDGAPMVGYTLSGKDDVLN